MRNIMHRITRALAAFMAGRNGMDYYSAVFFIFATLLAIIAQFTHLSGLLLFSYLLMGYSLFRVFSRNIYRRQQENQALLRLFYRIAAYLRTARLRFRDRKAWKYFRCPSCGQWLRIPRHKGKLRITCTRCRTDFPGKT